MTVMAIPWIQSVKQSGHLSVFLADSVKGGPWAVTVKHAIDEFNAISKRLALGVKLTPSSDPPSDTGGANVSVETGGGSVSASWGNSASSANFSGSGLHGHTFLFGRDAGLEKVFVFLPLEPKINAPKGPRAVGAQVMKLIAIHEFFHACGLENGDHTTDDLFQGVPNVELGDSPSGDTVVVTQGRKVTARMPPAVVGGTTIKNIKALWSK